MANRSTTAAYSRDAASLVPFYETYLLEDVFANMLHLFPEQPSRILDIGAGSGRHAAPLAKRGHMVVAVEPTKELREAGMALHGDVPLTWVDDALPALPLLAQGEHAVSYDFILMAAVIMHFDEEERETILRRVAELLTPGGRCVMSLRHGPVPEGRRMFPVTWQGIVSQAERYGFTHVHHTPNRDMSGRPGVSWTMLCLDKTA